MLLPPAQQLSVAVKLPNGEAPNFLSHAWSEPIDLNQIISGELPCGGVDVRGVGYNNLEYQLGAALSNAPPPFDPCVVVTLTPRFVVRNLVSSQSVAMRASPEEGKWTDPLAPGHNQPPRNRTTSLLKNARKSGGGGEEEGGGQGIK